MLFPYLSYFLSFPESDFFKAYALMGANGSVHRLSQCFILFCWLQTFHPFILLTSADGICNFQTLHGIAPSYH